MRYTQKYNTGTSVPTTKYSSSKKGSNVRPRGPFTPISFPTIKVIKMDHARRVATVTEVPTNSKVVSRAMLRGII